MNQNNSHLMSLSEVHVWMCHRDGSVCEDGCDRAPDLERLDEYVLPCEDPRCAACVRERMNADHAHFEHYEE